MSGRPLVLLMPMILTAIGCGPPHIAPFTPRERTYKQGAYAQTDKAGGRRTGRCSAKPRAVICRIRVRSVWVT